MKKKKAIRDNLDDEKKIKIEDNNNNNNKKRDNINIDEK